MATTSQFPNTTHDSNQEAEAALVNKAVDSGYVAADLAKLSMGGLRDSLLANLLHQGRLFFYTVNFNPAAIAAALTAEQAVTVTGVLTTDVLLSIVPASALTAGTFISGFRISAADTVQLCFGNTTAGSLDPSAAIDYKIIVLRP